MNWIENVLNGVNKDLRKLEVKKAREKDPEIWFCSVSELEAIRTFASKIRGYKPKTPAQAEVIDYALNFDPEEPYKVLESNRDEIDSYIHHSGYWVSNSDAILNIRYATNNDMRSVIFEYNGRWIISTGSSFLNYKRKMNGKPLKFSNGYIEDIDATDDNVNKVIDLIGSSTDEPIEVQVTLAQEERFNRAGRGTHDRDYRNIAD